MISLRNNQGLTGTIYYNTEQKLLDEGCCKLFAYAQKALPGIPLGVPIISAILMYWESGWSHSFNANKRVTRENLEGALGKVRPTSLDTFVNVLDDVIKYGQRQKAVDPNHALGAWRLVALMYRTHLNDSVLLDNIVDAVKQWVDVC